MKNIFWTLVFIFLVINLFAYDIEIPKSKKAIVGVKVSDFKDAVKIENFNTMDTLYAGDPKTELYLKYDNKNLYALFVCYEKTKGYPEAAKRRADLMRDDAVQIVLGTSVFESARGSISVGGYEGAYSQLNSCDFYYQFTVNSVNAKTREYLEMLLDRPLFDSKTLKDTNKWTVLMTIPFSSWGMKDPEGQEVFFNAYRSRPPERLGYYNLYYGSYTPMKFAKAKFGTEPKVINTFTREQTETENIVNELSIRYYPDKKQIIAQGSMSKLSDTYKLVLESDKSAPVEKELTEGDYNHINYGVNESDLPINAKAKIVSSSGKVIREENLKLETLPEKTFKHNDLGKSDAVPHPWITPTIDNKTVKLLNKDITIGKEGFFASVKGKEELLAKPMYLDLSVNGKKQTLNLVSQTLEPFKRGVLVNSAYKCESGTFEIKLKIDFDGCTMIKMRSLDIEPALIDKITLNIPIKKENALFINRYYTQTVRELDGLGWSNSVSPLWVGSHEMGIGYEYEWTKPVFLSKNKRKQMEIIENKDMTIWKLNLVDGKNQIEDKGHIFRFYLTPTPTKDYTLDKTGIYHGIDLWHEAWSKHQGYFDYEKFPNIKVKEDKELSIYFSHCHAKDSPWAVANYNDITAFPVRNVYTRAYDPGKGVPCAITCLRDLYGDLILEGVDYAVKTRQLSSVYLDGPAGVWDCYNPTHTCCEGNMENKWEDDVIYPIEESREFLIRLRKILDGSGKHVYVLAHTGGCISPCMQSLCDEYYEGEQIARYKKGYDIPLATFATAYCGTPWGMRNEVLPMSNINNVRRLLALSLLHDSPVGQSKYGYELEEKIYKDFQDDKLTDFYPYWKAQDKITRTGKSLLTYYLNSDKALLNFGNISLYKDTVTCDVTKLFGENVTITDMETDEILSDNPSNITFDLEPNHYRILLVENKKSDVKPTQKVNKEKGSTNWSPEAFKVVDNNSLHGIIDKGIGNFFGEFEFEKEDIFNIYVGNTLIAFHETVWTDKADPWSNGIIISDNFKKENKIHVKISVVGDDVDLIINDKVVLANLKVDLSVDKLVFQFAKYKGHKIISASSEGEELIPNIHPVL